MANRIPEDPIVRKLVGMFNQQQVSRRQLLRGAAVGAAGASTLALAACAPGGGSGGIDRGDGSAGSFVWGNWPLYLDYDEANNTYPSLDAFMAQTNINVDYIEDIDDNNTFYGKIKDQLAQNQYTGYDVITFTDWMNARLIDDGQVQAFDYANMPNVTANLIQSQWDALSNDPGRQYTVPWQLPAACFIWDNEAVPNGIKTLDDFLQPDLKGKVGMLSEMRDTMGIIMLGQGVNISGDWGDAEFDLALEWLQKAVDGGWVVLKGNSYAEDLELGNTVAAIAWTGDMVATNVDLGNPWTLEVPESGGTIAADAFTIPNGTDPENKPLIEEMINYYYEPEVAAQVADYVWFVTPVQGAQEAMEQINPENVDNPFIFPDAEMDSRLHSFRALSPQEDKKYSEAFAKVMGL